MHIQTQKKSLLCQKVLKMQTGPAWKYDPVVHRTARSIGMNSDDFRLAIVKALKLKRRN